MSIVQHIILWLAEMMLGRAMLKFVYVDDVVNISTVKVNSIKLLPVSIQIDDSWPLVIKNRSGRNASVCHQCHEQRKSNCEVIYVLCCSLHAVQSVRFENCGNDVYRKSVSKGQNDPQHNCNTS